MITTPAGDHVTRLYLMGLGIYPGEVDPHDDGRLPFILPIELIAIECSPGRDFEVLIGMDVLGRATLHIAADETG